MEWIKSNFDLRNPEGGELMWKVGPSKFSYMKYTPVGLLRSRNEIIFYDKLIAAGFIPGDDFVIDAAYPGTNMRSDFYFKNLGINVEIGGMKNSVEYVDKMTDKMKKFGCFVLWEHDEYDAFIERLVNENDTLRNRGIL